MKTVILAGGLGSRLAEETHKIPKPMVKINGEPILLHIMRLYSYHSLKRFVICTGYKNRVVSRYFISKFLLKDEAVSRTISVEVGMQNSGLGVVLAKENFINPAVAIPAAISSLVHSLYGSIFVAMFSTRSAEPSLGKNPEIR